MFAKRQCCKNRSKSYIFCAISEPTPSEDVDEKGSIVDMLLADVRSGFKKMGETNFSVTKVKKITLDSGATQTSLPSPVPDTTKQQFERNGSLRRSVRKSKRVDGSQAEVSEAPVNDLNQTGSRRSYAVDTDGTLFDILMQQENDSTNGSPSSFTRMGSLRRRRSERVGNREREHTLTVGGFDRERAASPNIEAQNKDVSETKERPKSDIISEADYQKLSTVRRSRSLHDKTAASDSSPRRMYDPNNNKSEDNLSIDRSLTPEFRSGDPNRRSSRWRADIPDVKGLPIIDEKSRLVTPTKELDVVSKFQKGIDAVDSIGMSKDDSFAVLEKKNKDMLYRRLSTSNLQESIRVLETAEDIKNKTDEHTESRISRSVRSKLNTRWHSELNKTDIDNVLKAIEDTGKQIEEIVKIDPPSKKQLVDKKVVPQGDPNEPAALKLKRQNRKGRSHVSLEDISAAFKMNKVQNSNDDSSESERSSDVFVSSTPKSTLENEESKTDVDKEAINKAAKLAGKKRFRDQRFGDKDKETPAQRAMLEHSQGRWKSNVEKENIDEAFKDYMSKNNMSRSKSYDEAVARKLMCEDVNFKASNEEKRNSLRNSSAKIYNDDRRNGKVFDDESDSENFQDLEKSSRRLSGTASTRSDSPRSSSSRLSIKSTNTSTETLRETCSDGENSPEQKRKNSLTKNLSDKIRESQTPSPSLQNRISDTRPETPLALRAEYLIGTKTEDTVLNKYGHLYDEDDDSPQAKMAKWRKKRSQGGKADRTSIYDNVHVESGNLSPRQLHDDFKEHNSPRSESSSICLVHKTQCTNELQNEIGSRCSYASSSDSASKDEGFDSMSGSQRTSLSSTLESVDIFNVVPSKKQEMSRLQMNENLIAANALPSVSDTKKQRTESWTEAVANNVGVITKEPSSESTSGFSATSPDSGHSSLRDDSWPEHSDLESTLKAGDSRPMSPASSVYSTGKKEKKVPSYMRGTASSSSRRSHEPQGSEPDKRRSSTSGSSVSRTGRLSMGSSTQSLSRARTGSNTSIVSVTSNASESSGVGSVKKRTSGTMRDRPSSIHSSMPGSRSITPLPKEARAQTPTHKTATKPAAHASSTIGARSAGKTKSPAETPKTTKSRPAPTPPSGNRSKTSTPKSLTPSGRTTPSTTGRTTPSVTGRTTPSVTGRTTPSVAGRTTPDSRLRSATPVSSSSVHRSTTPSIEEECDVVDVNEPSRLRRTQSMRVKSGVSRPSTGGAVSKEAPARSIIASARTRSSFMSPTASSKARVDKMKAEEGSPPPTPPPRRSKDTDSLPSSSERTQSPLKRYGSLRLPSKTATKTGSDKTGVKSIFQKIGSSSKVRPEADATGKLATVNEAAEKDSTEEATKEGGKSPSLRKILTFRGKDKSVRKSTDSLKK